MAEIYVITRIIWEENYYTPIYCDSEGRNPIKAYRSAEIAEKACNSLNIKAYREITRSKFECIGDYVNNWEEIKESASSLEELGVRFDAYNGKVELPKKATNKEMSMIIAMLGIVFYQIMPIELIDDNPQ